jgi:hypothetical protein
LFIPTRILTQGWIKTIKDVIACRVDACKDTQPTTSVQVTTADFETKTVQVPAYKDRYSVILYSDTARLTSAEFNGYIEFRAEIYAKVDNSPILEEVT